MVACVLDDSAATRVAPAAESATCAAGAAHCFAVPLLQWLWLKRVYGHTTHRVTDVYVCSIGQVCHCRVQVDDVAWQLVLVQVGVDALNQSCLA